MDLTQLPDILLVVLYEYWSELYYSASFLLPDPERVTQFREWLHELLVGWEKTHEESRLALIAEFRRQESRHDIPRD